MIHDSAVHSYKNPELAPWALDEELAEGLETRSPTGHTHDDLAALSHTHSASDITNPGGILDRILCDQNFEAIFLQDGTIAWQ